MPLRWRCQPSVSSCDSCHPSSPFDRMIRSYGRMVRAYAETLPQTDRRRCCGGDCGCLRRVRRHQPGDLRSLHGYEGCSLEPSVPSHACGTAAPVLERGDRQPLLQDARIPDGDGVRMRACGFRFGAQRSAGVFRRYRLAIVRCEQPGHLCGARYGDASFGVAADAARGDALARSGVGRPPMAQAVLVSGCRADRGRGAVLDASSDRLAAGGSGSVRVGSGCGHRRCRRI